MKYIALLIILIATITPTTSFAQRVFDLRNYKGSQVLCAVNGGPLTCSKTALLQMAKAVPTQPEDEHLVIFMNAQQTETSLFGQSTEGVWVLLHTRKLSTQPSNTSTFNIFDYSRVVVTGTNRVTFVK